MPQSRKRCITVLPLSVCTSTAAAAATVTGKIAAQKRERVGKKKGGEGRSNIRHKWVAQITCYECYKYWQERRGSTIIMSATVWAICKHDSNYSHVIAIGSTSGWGGPK